MIRIVIAILAIIFGLFSVALGGHPIQAIISCLIAMGFLAWYCVDRFEVNGDDVRY